jgi:hypothetical protein
MKSPVMSKFDLSIGGYVKLDYAHNTNGFGPISPAGGLSLATNHKDESISTAKQTRFWLKAAGPNFLGAKTSALIEMDLFGVYGQLKFFPTQDLEMTVGYGQRHVLNYANSPDSSTTEKYNEMLYGNVHYDLNAAVRVATEYSYERTQYGGLSPNVAQNNCFRLAAYYFF